MNTNEKWALISVYDKSGIVPFAETLVGLGWKIMASGGTAKALVAAGVRAHDVANFVGRPILGHRVVTLSRQIHAALLADLAKPEDLAELVKSHIPLVDLVRCDFYPLGDAIAKPDATMESVIELTDIGGPTMVRSGAKGNRIVISRAEDMGWVLDELKQQGDVSKLSRQRLRARAEFEVARYVAESAKYHGAGQFHIISGECLKECKGENGPQSPAGLYSSGGTDPLALEKFEVIEGAPLSYNNFCDIDRLLQTMSRIKAAHKAAAPPHMGALQIALGAKHGNLCGASAAYPGDLASMIRGDRRAIFGGVIMTNFEINEDRLHQLFSELPDDKILFDAVVAPSFDAYAISRLSRTKGRCRLVVDPALVGDMPIDQAPRFRQVRGGFLVQPASQFVLDFKNPEMQIYGQRNEWLEQDLLLAWAIGSTSNSNTITIVKEDMLLGNGVGQQDRVGAAELAVKRAVDAGHQELLKGAVAYSDSFFPFADGAGVLIDAGIKAIFSTSGSVRDKEVQQLCQERGVTLYQLPDAKARGFFGH